MVLWQLQETVRRALMAEMRIAACIVGDSISYLGQAAAILALGRLGHLNLPIAFLAIAVTSGGAACAQSLQVGISRVGWTDLRTLAQEFWRLGSWSALSSFTALGSTFGFTWTLRVFHGLSASADYAAMILPIKLVNPIIFGVGNAMLPAIANASGTGRMKSTAVTAGKYASLGAIIIFPYYGVLIAFPHAALSFAFGHNSPYVAYAPWLRTFVGNMVLVYLEFVLLGWLGGLGRSRESFFAQVIQVLAAVGIGLPLTAWYGIPGLVYGQCAALVVGVGAEIYFVLRVLRDVRDSVLRAPLKGGDLGGRVKV